MNTGDPMWTCPFCRETYYVNNKTACDCNAWRDSMTQSYSDFVNFIEKDEDVIKEFKDYQPPGWDEFFMKGVYWIATKSKDPRTKIGSVVVLDHRPILWGFNGIAEGVQDLPERMKRPIKYKYMAHAERNACYQAAKFGISAKNGIMYSQGIPCCDCAIAVIQSGIKEVVVHKQWGNYEDLFMNNREQWKDHNDISSQMFKEADVKLRVLDCVLDEIGYLDGKIIKV